MNGALTDVRCLLQPQSNNCFFIAFVKALSSECRRSAAFSFNDLTGDGLKASLNFVWQTMDLNKLGAAVASCENRVVRFPCDSPTYNGAIKRASMWHDAGVAQAEQTTVRVCVLSLPLSHACSRTTSQNVSNPEEKSTFGCLAHTLCDRPLSVLRFLIA